MSFRFGINGISPTCGKGGGGSEINNQDKTITENGQYIADEGYTGLGTVNVNVPNPSTGTLSIEQNGTFDVTDYAEAQVNVPSNELAKIDVYTNWDSYYSGGVGAVLTSMSYKEGKYYLLDENKNSKGYACRICDNSTRVEDGYHVRKCEALWRRDKTCVARVNGAIHVTPENAKYEIITEGLIWDFSESKGFKTAAGWPVSAKVTAPRYYDTWNTITLGPNVIQSGWHIYASSYPGLTTTYDSSSGLITILGKQQLPNRTYNDKSFGYIGEAGNTYTSSILTNSLQINGSLTVNDGVYSGFYKNTGSGRYLYLDKQIPSEITNFKFISRFKTGTSRTRDSVIFSLGTEQVSSYIGEYWGSWTYRLTGRTSGATSKTSTWYWYQIVYENNKMNYYYLEDNDYTLETLPELQNWNLLWSMSNDLVNYQNKYFTFGVDLKSNEPSATSEALAALDMNNTIIDINNQPFFRYEGIQETITGKGMLAEGLTDDGEEKLYNLYYQDGNYCLDTAEEKEGWTWVGKITIPQHEPFTPVNSES